MALSTGVCEVWPTDFTTCHQIPDTLTPEQRTRYIRAASDYLWAMTGRRYGQNCPITVRPCRKSCADGWASSLAFWPAGYNGSPWIPYVDTMGNMRNAVLCGCRGNTCHCGPELCEIELPGPVHTIVQVQVGPDVLDENDYHMRDGRFLIRMNPPPVTDGGACWPACQDLTAQPGQPDTFAVTYSTGIPVPALGVLAASSLAAHMMQDCGGCGGCGTDSRKNLSRLTRQGVELEFADPQQVFTDGRTGIEIVDQFIRAFNPHGLASPLRVLSPDYRRPALWHTST